MGKLRQTALILGEGPTEFFYFKSLCDVFKRLTIKPDYPKHTNLKELDAKIAEGVAMGYSHIFCIIDMDTKFNRSELILALWYRDRRCSPCCRRKHRRCGARRHGSGCCCGCRRCRRRRALLIW